MTNEPLREPSGHAHEGSDSPSPKHTEAKMKTRKESHSVERSGKGLVKLFVLDTNVLMHDPTSLFRFEEHDVYLPMVTLEELDDHKKGMSEVARNAR
jgi:PhoH-like ATPase